MFRIKLEKRFHKNLNQIVQIGSAFDFLVFKSSFDIAFQPFVIILKRSQIGFVVCYILIAEVVVDALRCVVEDASQGVGLHFVVSGFGLFDFEDCLIIESQLTAQIGVDGGRRKTNFHLLFLIFWILFLLLTLLILVVFEEFNQILWFLHRHWGVVLRSCFTGECDVLDG